MNDYLISGTRQQYWEEYFVKHVMSVGFGGLKYATVNVKYLQNETNKFETLALNGFIKTK